MKHNGEKTGIIILFFLIVIYSIVAFVLTKDLGKGGIDYDKLYHCATCSFADGIYRDKQMTHPAGVKAPK